MKTKIKIVPINEKYQLKIIIYSDITRIRVCEKVKKWYGYRWRDTGEYETIYHYKSDAIDQVSRQIKLYTGEYNNIWDSERNITTFLDKREDLLGN